MIIRKLFLLIFLLSALQSCCFITLQQQFKQDGFVEINDSHHGTATYDVLYAYFDELIEFLQTNPAWTQKLYRAKERFIRTKERHYYSTDFFGFYDESQKEGRNQIAFYYSIHFHQFISRHYKEFTTIPEIINFFDACCEIQKPYGDIFTSAATELGAANLFASTFAQPPILLKIVKYLPSYVATRPHYDGTAFSLFLDSTDNQSLLLAPYKSLLSVNDFFSPIRAFDRSSNNNSMLLIPGTQLKDFFIDPTPHIVVERGNTRYATIAFAMRPHHTPAKTDFSSLPHFHD